MKSIDVKRGDRYLAREMMRIVFFLDKSHLKASDTVFAAFQRFLQFAPKNAVYLMNDPGGDWNDFDDQGQLVGAVRDRLMSEPREPNCSLIVCSEDSNISDYSFVYAGFNLDEPDFHDWASSITITCPLEFFQAKREAVQQLFMALLEGLPAFAGYASRSLEGEQVLIQKLARRYLGLDISSVSSIAKDISGRAPGSFWLNAYKGDLAAVLRPDLLSNEIPPDVRVVTVEGGSILVLVSGEPDRLSVSSAESVDGFRWLAHKLDELGQFHVPRRIIYFEDEDDLEDIDAQVAWHTRLLRVA